MGVVIKRVVLVFCAFVLVRAALLVLCPLVVDHVAHGTTTEFNQWVDRMNTQWDA
jgi:hypothetical protein